MKYEMPPNQKGFGGTLFSADKMILSRKKQKSAGPFYNGSAVNCHIVTKKISLLSSKKQKSAGPWYE